jgi:hypothetical protein
LIGRNSKWALKSGTTYLQYLRAGVEEVGPGVLDSLAKSVQKKMTGENRRDLYGGRPVHKSALNADARETMLRLLESEPEPSPAELEAFLNKIRAVLFGLKPDWRKVEKLLPHDAGGRRQKFPTERDRARVCNAIRKLVAEDFSIREAQQLVADNEDVSLITIQRVWRKCPRRNQS